LAIVPVLYFAIIYVLAVRGLWRDSFHLDPNALNDKIYAAGFMQAVSVADFIKSRSAPQDEIGIIGSEPEICFYAHRRCATSFLYVYPLMERQRFAAAMQDQMKRELQAEHPRFLVVVDNWSSWNWASTIKENRPFLDWAWDFAHYGYELVDQVTIPAGSNTPSLWGDRPRFYVFQRKDIGLTYQTEPRTTAFHLPG
jgi:hypothetical protein